jgi:RND family efflux transporter MFP subunit
MNSNVKKILFIIGILIVIGVMVAVLLNNKAKLKAKVAANEIRTEFPVTTIQAKSGKLDETLNLVGTTNPNAELNLLSEAQGRVLKVNFNVGDFVSEGKLLVQVDDELKKAALLSAEANYDKAKKDLDRFETLFKEKSVNESQLDQAKLTYKLTESQLIIAKKQLNDTKITSPISGFITSRNIEVGSVLSNNTSIAGIVDIATLKIKLNVAEKDVFKMKVGETVSAVSEIYPDKVFTGIIKNINAKGDEAHTYPIEIQVNNTTGFPLKAGMFLRVNFKSINVDEGIIIPRVALIGSIKNPQIYVIADHDGKKIAKIRDITIGNSLGDEVEVTKGLNVGETVIVNGQVNLKDSTQVSLK